ncbi:MAG TPA: EF-Tu/IF-2/RF-3 family GTPase, partial [Bdellovibrionota bacterium]|nr:EF-Tu/IF-2/RF-3 family GTPase [Bdellovibrionota bacterium]
EELYLHVQEGAPAELKIVIKGDVVGSVEALRDAIGKIKSAQVKTTVVHTGVGAVTESDVNLAAASDAMIIAFHVRPDSKAKALAETQGVQIKPYRVIYEAVQDIKGAMEGLLAPLIREQVVGRAEVRETFSVPKVGVIAGCSVSEGKVTRNSKVRLLRDNVVIHEGNVGSLKRFKEDAREVKEGFECGIGVENYNDIKPGDILEFFIMEEYRQTLQVESASKQTAKRE